MVLFSNVLTVHITCTHVTSNKPEPYHTRTYQAAHLFNLSRLVSILLAIVLVNIFKENHNHQSN